MKAQVTINGVETEMNLPKKGYTLELKRAVKDWRGAEIFIANFPEKGRALQKSAGYETIGAIG